MGRTRARGPGPGRDVAQPTGVSNRASNQATAPLLARLARDGSMGVQSGLAYLSRLDGISAPDPPTTMAITPPTSIHTDLSVGDPVKNLDTSELNESMASIPIMTSAIPPTTNTIDIILFIALPLFCVVLLQSYHVPTVKKQTARQRRGTACPCQFYPRHLPDPSCCRIGSWRKDRNRYGAGAPDPSQP